MNNKRNILWIIIIISISIFSALLISLFFIFLIFVKSRNKDNPLTSNVYQVSEINPFQNHTNTGFVTLTSNNRISNEEYISFVNPQSGSIFFITNFFDKEYTCTGSCYCKTDPTSSSSTKRKSIPFFSPMTTKVLTNSLLIILSSFSLSLAQKLAKETFQNTCILKFTTDDSDNDNNSKKQEKLCDEILSKVDECYESSSENIISENFGESEQIHEYSCHGHCLKNKIFDPSKYPIPPEENQNQNQNQKNIKFFSWNDYEKQINCEDYKLSKDISVSAGNQISYSSDKYLKIKAEYEFEINHLYFLCQQVSLQSYPSETTENLEKLNYFIEDENIVPLEYHLICASNDLDNLDNKNIKCIKKEMKNSIFVH